jgi:hypothetical protein
MHACMHVSNNKSTCLQTLTFDDCGRIIANRTGSIIYDNAKDPLLKYNSFLVRDKPKQLSRRSSLKETESQTPTE